MNVSKQAHFTQTGYALFLVMGLLLLASIGVMATYKAVSSLDKKSANTLYNHSAKQSTTSGHRIINSWMSNNTADALGILNTIYTQKYDSASPNFTGTTKIIKLPIHLGSHSGNQSFQTFITDLKNENDQFFIKTHTEGIGQNNSHNLQEAWYKVDGIKTIQTQITVPSSSDSSLCTPNVALYMGGNQQTNILKYVAIKGGFYSNNLHIQSGATLDVVSGDLIVGGMLDATDMMGGLKVQDGNSIFTSQLAFTSSTPSYFGGDVEFVRGWRNNTGGTFNITGNLRVHEWMRSGTFNLNVGQNFSIMSGKIRNVAGNLYYNIGQDFYVGDTIDYNNGGAPLTLDVGGNVFVEKALFFSDAWGAAHMRLANLSGAVRYGQNFAKGGNSSITCGGIDCTPQLNPSFPINIAPSYYTQKGLSPSNSYRLNNDIGIDEDSINVHKFSWQNLVAKYNALRGTSLGSVSFDVNTANTLSEDVEFVNQEGYAGFLIVDVNNTSSLPNIYFNANGSNQKFRGKLAWIMDNGSTDFTSQCFPEVAPEGNVFIWTKTGVSSFRFDVCDADGDGLHDFRGYIKYDAPNNSNNMLPKDVYHRFYGSIYLNGGNSNVWLNGSSQDSIFMDVSALSEIASLGFIKYDANNNVTHTCIDQSRISGTIILGSHIQATSSQLNVTQISNKYKAVTQGVMDTLNKYQEAYLPNLGLNISQVTIKKGDYNAFEDLTTALNIKPYFQYAGKQYTEIDSLTNCSGLWEDPNQESNPDISAIQDSTLTMTYTLTCSGESSRRHLLVYFDKGIITIPASSAEQISSSTITISSSEEALSSIPSSSASNLEECEGELWVSGSTNGAGFGNGTLVYYESKQYKAIGWTPDSDSYKPGESPQWLYENDCSEPIVVEPSCGGIAECVNGQVYNGGETCKLGNQIYEAKWWINSNPTGSAWRKAGNCS